MDQYGRISTHGLDQLLSKVQAKLRVSAAIVGGKDPWPLEIEVFGYNEPLAFSTRGGRILVSKGLILSLRNEDEFAAVIAHEISHHVLGHLDRVASPSARSPKFILSKEDEFAADKLSVRVLQGAGYDPLAALSALRTLERKSSIDAAKNAEFTERENALASELAPLPLQKPRSNQLFRRIQMEILAQEPEDSPLRSSNSR